MRRIRNLMMMVVAAVMLPATGAYACGFLVAENGAIRLDTFTAAAVLTESGDAHYVTSFSFQGSPESFGAVIPLPDIPYEVEKAPGWFLQRLGIETTPPPPQAALFAEAASDASGAQVIASYEVDSLDIVVLKGGGEDVISWARDNGFSLGGGDATEGDLTAAIAMLDFYAERSPIFAAIKFDNSRAAEQDLRSGDGTPVRFSFHNQDHAWIPVKVLGFDKPAEEIVVADLYLMTPEPPRILGGLVDGTDVVFQQSYTENSDLVLDLHDDERAEWIPTAFTLTRVDVRTRADRLDWDIAAGVDRLPPAAAAFGVAYSNDSDGVEYVGNAPLDNADLPRGELGEGGGAVRAVTGSIAMMLIVAGAIAVLRRRAHADA